MKNPKSNRYPQKFKDDAVKELLESGDTLQKTSKRLGISISVLHKWKQAVKNSNFEERYDVIVALEEVQKSLKSVFGFKPSVQQTLQFLIKKADLK